MDGVTQKDKCWVTVEGRNTAYGWDGPYNTPTLGFYACGMRYKVWGGDGIINVYVKYCNIANWNDQSDWVLSDKSPNDYE